MAMSEMDYMSGGGGGTPSETVAYIGEAYVNNYYFAVDNTNPSKYHYGSVSSTAYTVSDFTLCSYELTMNFDIKVTAKTKVKIIAHISDGATIWDEEHILETGQSVTTARHSSSTSGTKQGTSVQAIAL